MNSNHVFARLVGHGQAILPAPRYRVSRVEDDERRLQISANDEALAAELRIETGAVTYQLAEGTAELKEVCDISAGPHAGAWRIDVGSFDLQWPAGTTLMYSDLSSSPFFLLGSEGVVAYFQGPFPKDRLSAPALLGAPGQALVAEGVTSGHRWAEFQYQHERQAWRQRQCAVLAGESTGFLLTVQYPASKHEEATALHESLASTFRLSTRR